MIASDLWSRLRGGWGGRLAPFFKCVAVYAAAAASGGGGPPRAPRPALAAVKAAPALCLAVLLYLAHCDTTTNRRGAGLAALGLVWSAAGDALLVWGEAEAALLAGMACFAAAHALYAAAWPARPVAPALGLMLQAAAWSWTGILQAPPVLKPWTRVYGAALAAAAWRGGAPAWAGQRDAAARWAAAGAALFVLSDAALGYGMFNSPLPYQQVVVMSTYYAAQLCIALSVLQPPLAPSSAP